jgi:uncharacterized membrane protein YgaE (UPF0421/DUF939 family)
VRKQLLKNQNTTKLNSTKFSLKQHKRPTTALAALNSNRYFARRKNLQNHQDASFGEVNHQKREELIRRVVAQTNFLQQDRSHDNIVNDHGNNRYNATSRICRVTK